MRRLIVGALAAVLAGPAMAADLPPRMPVKAPVASPAYNWSGFYAGGHVGYGWDPASATFDPAAYAAATAPTLVVATATAPFGMSVDPSGVLGGLQFGANFQNGAFVYGVEADVSFAAIREEANRGFAVTGTVGGDNGDFTGNVRLRQELDYFGTVRGRLGVANDTWLLYATGGLAWGHVKTTFEVNNIVLASPGNYGGVNPPPYPVSASASAIHFGYAVGGGLEWAFAPRWTARAEYLYIDFGSGGDTLVIPGGVAHTSDLNLHVARFGVNYRM
jgi:outer membrane immunogenic protein